MLRIDLYYEIVQKVIFFNKIIFEERFLQYLLLRKSQKNKIEKHN